MRPGSGSAELTYPEVGASLGVLPVGYHHLDARRRLGTGQACFDRARARLLNWDMHRTAGLRVPVDGPVTRGSTLVLGLGPVGIPVRVVALVDEPDRAGFAYGTLPGHPESGEESFVVRRDTGDEVWIEIRAFSRPGVWWMRAAGPLGRWGQAAMTRRYLEALKS